MCFRLRNRLTKFSPKDGRLFGNQSGQGALEYILVLVVVVGIIIGGVWQVNDAFRVWAKNYFGDYLACLMETGELPGIGSTTGGGECNQSFKEFTIADGRPASGGGSDGGNDSGSGGGNGSGEDSGGSTDGSSTGSDGGGASERTLVGRGSSRSGGSLRGASRFQTAAGGAGAGGIRSGQKRKIYTGDTSNVIGGFTQGGSKRRFKTRGGFQNYGGSFGSGEDPDKNEGEGLVRSSARGKDDEKNSRKNRIIIRKVAKVDPLPEEEPMTFGSFIRYLIIAGIIIALLIFIGGQALQVGKNME